MAGEVLQGLSFLEAETPSVALATSPQLEESSKRLLGALLELGEARGESLSELKLLVYVRDLGEKVERGQFDVADVVAACRELGCEEREQYTKGFPELGTIMARSKRAEVERTKPPKCEDCSVCGNNRLVIVDQGGRKVARECECIVRWRAKKLRL